MEANDVAKPWHQRHRSAVASAGLAVAATAYRAAQQIGIFRNDAYTFPFLVLGAALTFLYLAITSSPARVLFIRFGEQDAKGRVQWSVAGLVATVVLLVVLGVGFTLLQRFHARQLARLRGDPLPLIVINDRPDDETGRLAPTGAPAEHLANPFEAMEQRQRQADEQTSEMQRELAKVVTQFTEALQRFNSLQEAARSTPAPSTTPEAPGPQRTPMPQPSAPENIRLLAPDANEQIQERTTAITLNLTPDRSCAQWGAQGSPLNASEDAALREVIPRFLAEATGLTERLLAAGETNAANTIAAMSQWHNRAGNQLDNLYGPLAQVDFLNAPASDVLLAAAPVELRSSLPESAISSLRRMGGGLSCLAAVQANLTTRSERPRP